MVEGRISKYKGPTFNVEEGSLGNAGDGLWHFSGCSLSPFASLLFRSPLSMFGSGCGGGVSVVVISHPWQ